MRKINIVENEYQQFRKACLEVIDENIEICYNNNILKHNFNYSSKLRDDYKHHLIRHDGAMSAIESEITNIYQTFVYGGVITKSNIEYLDIGKYDIIYSEGDNMIGMKELTLKTNGRQLYTTTYMYECKCGKKGFASVKSAFLPRCPKCSGEAHVAPQITMEELVEKSSLINRNPENHREITLFNENRENGFKVKLILDEAQAKTLEEVKGRHTLAEGLKILFSTDKKTIDANKGAEQPRQATVAPPKRIVSTTAKKSKSKITDEDLTFVLQHIRTNFNDKSFKSRDLAPKVVERLTARQLPSRLTQLVNKGILTADSSSPKNYSLVKGE